MPSLKQKEQKEYEEWRKKLISDILKKMIEGEVEPDKVDGIDPIFIIKFNE